MSRRNRAPRARSQRDRPAPRGPSGRRPRDLTPPSPRAALALIHRHYDALRQWMRGVVLAAAQRARVDADRSPWLALLDDSAPLSASEAEAFAVAFGRTFGERLALDPGRGGPPAWPTIAALSSVARPASRLSAVRALAEMRRLGVPPALAAALFGVPGVDPITGLTTGAIAFGIIDPMTSPIVAAGIDRWATTARDYIVAIPRDQIQEIPEWVRAAAVEGRSWRDLAEVVESRIGVSERHAELIARDQIAKVNSSITEAMHGAAGVTEYRWVTASDDRVRETHRQAALAGPYRWGDLALGAGAPGVGFSGERGHPGQCGQCRCTAEPVPPAWWREVRLAASRRDRARVDALIAQHARMAA